MRFPQDFIEDLKRQADIVRVVSDYVTLKKKGANWMACCPFHQEKTPSFSVSPSKGIFYCFGCGQKGGVFNFVMEVERVSFPEAVRIVAGKAGVALPELVEDKRFEARRQEADEVIQLNAWALEFWEGHLQEGGEEARAAREYVEGRGISDETRAVFRLGYAPNSWDALGNYLKSKGATIGQIERSGLVVKKDAGGFYDRFRGRLIFPVLDAQGRPVAFGARAMRAGDEPKYLNSPETAAYTKGRHLFGLNASRDEIRKKKFAILVEGYLDLIIPFQFGIRNIVAGLGTALTAEQAKLLGRFARKVVVNYDGDQAGKKAARRAIDSLLQTLISEDFDIKVLVLPGGADPDEFIRTKGVAEYNKRRGEAPTWIQFVIDQAVGERDLRNPGAKTEAIDEILPYLRSVPLGNQGTKRREYFGIAMNALSIEPELHRDLWAAVKKSSGGSNEEQTAVRQKILRTKRTEMTIAERKLLEFLVNDAELREALLPLIAESDYEALVSASVFRAIKDLDARRASIDFASISEATEGDPAAADIVPLVLMYEPERAEGEATDVFLAEAESCLMTLRLMSYDRRLKELATEINAADRAGDAEARDRLIMEDLELKRLRTALLPRAAGVMPGSPSSS